MKRTNSPADALNRNKAVLDLGDGLPPVELPLDGNFGGGKGDPGEGVPTGGAPLQVIRKNVAGTAAEWATLGKSMVGLDQVENTSDADKPISNAAQAALETKASANALGYKADLESGKVPVAQLPTDALVTDTNVAAQVNGPATGAAIDSRIATQVTPIVEDITSAYIGTEPAVVAAAAAAVDANPKIAGLETSIANITIPALSQWFDALAARGTKAAQVIVLGDSIAEGADAGIITGRWQTLVQRYLREAYGVPAGAIFPFIPALPATSGATGWPVTVSGPEGTVVSDVNWGFGWRSAKVFAGGLVTFTFSGTSAALMFTKASGTGKIRVTVDGGSPVVVDSNSVTNGPTADSATWSTGALAPGTHTVTVAFDPSTPVGVTSVIVQGLLTWNGDENSGIRVLDAAHSGYRSAHFTATNTRVAANALKAAGGASLAIIGIGTNDTLYPADFPLYRANIERMIAALRTTAGFTGSVLLVHWYMTNQMTSEQWEPYGVILAQIAAADPKVAYLDMRRRMPDMPTPYTGPEGLGLYAGNVHPGPRGQKFIGDEIAGYLTNGR